MLQKLSWLDLKVVKHLTMRSRPYKMYQTFCTWIILWDITLQLMDWILEIRIYLKAQF